MDDPAGISRSGLSIHEAAVILGVSPNTVRRRVATGSIRSERIPRPQGDVIRVYLDHLTGEVPKQVPPEVVPGDVPNEVPPTSQVQVPDTTRVEAMAALISASITPVLAPLVAQLEADRQTIERQGETIRDQAERLGRQSAELDTARAQISTLEARTAPQPSGPTPEPPVARWRAWGAGALMVLTIVALVVLLAWPR